MEIQVINTWAVPVVKYPDGIVDWTQSELEKFDWKTWKLMNMHHILYPKNDADEFYLMQN